MTLPDLTLPQMLREQARRAPAKVAIRQKDFGIWKPLTWQAYAKRAMHVGLGLRAIGLAAGGHVGVLSENRTEWVLTQMGAGLVGGVTVGVYPTSPASEVAYVVGHADIEVIVCEDQEQTDKVIESLALLPRLRHIVVIETKGLRNLAPEHRDKVTTFAELERLGAASAAQGGGALVDAALTAQTLDDIGLMIYTSGSTGKPKGAMLSYRNIRGVVPGIVERLGLDSDTTHLSYLPLCHVAEQMLTAFVPPYLGSQVNFGESIRTVQEDLREVAPSIFLGVPRIWEKLHASISIKLQETGRLQRGLFDRAWKRCEPLAAKPRAQWSLADRTAHAASYWLVLRALQNFIGLRRVKVALTGAAPIPPDVVRFFRTLGVPLVEVYGLTESSGMVTGHRADDVVVGTVGPPTLGAAHRVADNGELLLRGDMVFAGYYKNDEATAQSICDGWLHTGDVVRQEPNGHLRIVDRLKDIMITAGGKNLTPSEIENTMKGSPYIKECVIVAEGRKFVGALIQIDYETVGKWAEAQHIPFTNFRSLTEHADVLKLIGDEVARGNGKLAQVSHIRRFHLLAKELDHDDGDVTATMKVRRSAIYQSYAGEIEALYRS
ncbi:AMP-dependent synthetase/ligase [Variovorax guangxiensis]|uniref:Long-chain fatty acid--CoA ligase n=1 Tax=Variovorax guangxiensis TaxID=1775474 RepID=A0A502DRS5_9BURK|nr:AMP-binding protein [Variovorax guangxiensis]RZI65507.1 MAG: long-chain fatty acid--CoA ligase [Variovorax sp.]TPG23217.1 long-chain fatty acid--CoA ligase [Variovorax ginsengisoli]TPG27764.1 long-chain fatty acid--CoA ligase [Variovorax guangxiensis]